MISVLFVASDGLTREGDLKRPVGLRSGTSECPAKRAGDEDQDPVCITFFYRYSYEPRHFMTRMGASPSGEPQLFSLIQLPSPKRQQILQVGKIEMRAAEAGRVEGLGTLRVGRQD